jgi:Cu(I)/Ag(I) efflux system membrane fusion protein
LGKNSAVFNESFGKLLDSYLNLKDAFVERDSIKVNAEAKYLSMLADSLKVEEIKEDSAGFIRQTAQTYTGVISGSAVAIAGEKDFEGKLKEFEMISDAIWTLTRTVQYAGQKLYYQYCPMAFNNKGAYWVSNTLQIRNPYFGVDMVDCGEVEDSLDYSGK